MLDGITTTFLDYAEAADTGDVVAFSELFTDDCRFDGGRPSKGRSWIRQHAGKVLSQFKETSHHISNIRLRSVADSEAHASAYVYAVHRLLNDEMFEAWGRYECELRWDGGRWRFSHHRILLALERGTDGRTYRHIERADPGAGVPQD